MRTGQRVLRPDPDTPHTGVPRGTRNHEPRPRQGRSEEWPLRSYPDPPWEARLAELLLGDPDESDALEHELGRRHPEPRKPSCRPTILGIGLVVRWLRDKQKPTHLEERCGTFRGHRRGSERPGQNPVEHAAKRRVAAGLLCSTTDHRHMVPQSESGDRSDHELDPALIGVEQHQGRPGERHCHHQPRDPATGPQIEDPPGPVRTGGTLGGSVHLCGDSRESQGLLDVRFHRARSEEPVPTGLEQDLLDRGFVPNRQSRRRRTFGLPRPPGQRVSIPGWTVRRPISRGTGTPTGAGTGLSWPVR